jgi:hypothetical protein
LGGRIESDLGKKQRRQDASGGSDVQHPPESIRGGGHVGEHLGLGIGLVRGGLLPKCSGSQPEGSCYGHRARGSRRLVDLQQSNGLPRGEPEQEPTGQQGLQPGISLRQGSIITLCPFALLPFWGSRGLAPWRVDFCLWTRCFPGVFEFVEMSQPPTPSGFDSAISEKLLKFELLILKEQTPPT